MHRERIVRITDDAETLKKLGGDYAQKGDFPAFIRIALRLMREHGDESYLYQRIRKAILDEHLANAQKLPDAALKAEPDKLAFFGSGRSHRTTTAAASERRGRAVVCSCVRRVPRCHRAGCPARFRCRQDAANCKLRLAAVFTTAGAGRCRDERSSCCGWRKPHERLYGNADWPLGLCGIQPCQRTIITTEGDAELGETRSGGSAHREPSADQQVARRRCDGRAFQSTLWDHPRNTTLWSKACSG